MNDSVDLSKFSSAGFDKGAGAFKRGLWFAVNALVVRASWNPFIGIKVFMLRLFGARIGKNVVIKNNVTVKSPWNLVIGDNCWIGESVWIDNLDKVIIGSNVCLSQGSMLLTGNHDYTKRCMPYRNAAVTLDDGCWIGARATVCPGVRVHRNAVLTVGSVACKDLEENSIYQGIPAVKIRDRVIKDIN